jgi:hypothetical protein
MKTAFFVLLTTLALSACAKDDKSKADTAKEAKTVLAKVDDKPTPRVRHRMQLEPVTADKFALARKD